MNLSEIGRRIREERDNYYDVTTSLTIIIIIIVIIITSIIIIITFLPELSSWIETDFGKGFLFNPKFGLSS